MTVPSEADQGSASGAVERRHHEVRPSAWDSQRCLSGRPTTKASAHPSSSWNAYAWAHDRRSKMRSYHRTLAGRTTSLLPLPTCTDTSAPASDQAACKHPKGHRTPVYSYQAHCAIIQTRPPLLSVLPVLCSSLRLPSGCLAACTVLPLSVVPRPSLFANAQRAASPWRELENSLELPRPKCS